jgi:hypothetical protein
VTTFDEFEEPENTLPGEQGVPKDDFIQPDAPKCAD